MEVLLTPAFYIDGMHKIKSSLSQTHRSFSKLKNK